MSAARAEWQRKDNACGMQRVLPPTRSMSSIGSRCRVPSTGSAAPCSVYSQRHASTSTEMESAVVPDQKKCAVVSVH